MFFLVTFSTFDIRFVFLLTFVIIALSFLILRVEQSERRNDILYIINLVLDLDCNRNDEFSLERFNDHFRRSLYRFLDEKNCLMNLFSCFCRQLTILNLVLDVIMKRHEKVRDSNTFQYLFESLLFEIIQMRN